LPHYPPYIHSLLLPSSPLLLLSFSSPPLLPLFPSPLTTSHFSPLLSLPIAYYLFPTTYCPEPLPLPHPFPTHYLLPPTRPLPAYTYLPTPTCLHLPTAFHAPSTSPIRSPMMPPPTTIEHPLPLESLPAVQPLSGSLSANWLTYSRGSCLEQ
jgi:hypothetical protein